jgi:PAS domain S-box-containing protein
MNAPSLEQERPHDVFPNGGAMGELVRTKDWSGTPFGPIESWPQSLRTATALMLESSFAMVVAWGPEFRFLYNDRYRPVLGNKHPCSLGAPAREIFPEVWDDLIGPLFTRTRAGETVAMDDLYIPLHRHGYLENCYFSISYSPIRDETGGVGGMLAVVAETTERVEGERRLTTLRDLARRATEAGSAAEACTNAAAVLSENLLDVPFALLYLLDEDGRRARRVAVSGMELDHDACPRVITLDSPQAEWPLAAALRDGDTVLVEDVATRFGALPSGPYPEAVHTALVLPLMRPGAPAYGFLVAGIGARRAINERYRDFLELAADHITTAVANARMLEEERRRADALAEVDRAKTAFFSNVSHEFRTPLTLMLGPIEELLASRDSPLDPAARAQLEVTHRNSLRLLKLVNTLLDFSRLEAGRIHAHYEAVDLAAFTTELAGVFRAAIEKAGLRLRVECAAGGGPAFVDRDMWEKIVFNLLSNALKFTLAGEIGVQLRRSGDRFELQVSDTGVGIPARELPNLFKRFHRIENVRSRTHEGSGIGLALVLELARLHGGDVAAESRVGEGSTFTVTIPAGHDHLPADRVSHTLASTSRDRAPSSPTRVAAESFVEEALRWLPEEARRAAAEPQAGSVASANGSGAAKAAPPSFSPVPAPARILLADDNADMRDYVRRLLSVSYTVEAVADGEAALEAMRRQRPDLLLTDVMMPQRDGFELLRTIRGDPELRTIPVIMLSARAGNEASIEGYDAGADDYLIKPFTARELLSRVASHLKLARLRNEVRSQSRQLLANEERSAQLMDLVPTAVCICDAEGRVVVRNRRVAELLGRAPDIGERWSEFTKQFRVFLPDGGQVTDSSAPTMLAIREGRVFAEIELEVERADGTRFFLEANVVPVRDAVGRITGAVTMFHDITDRKREERNAAVIARISEEVADLAGEAQIVALVTRIVGEHLGVLRCYFTEEEPDGTRVAIHAGWSRDPQLPVLQGSYPTSEYGSAEFRAALRRQAVAIDDVTTHPLSRDFGQRFVVLEIRACLMVPFIREGRAVARIVVNDRVPRPWRPDEIALLESVVARIWPIVERARAARALRESEERFRGLADSMAALAWTADRLGWATWYNQRWYDYTGTTLAEMQGRGWERVHHPDHLARVREKIDGCLERGEPWEDTFPLRGRDGTYRWFLSRAVPMRDAAGAIVRWFGTNTDVTDLRTAQEQLRRRSNSLEVLNRAAVVLSEERDLEKIVQCVTDAGREVSGAEFGAFFYNVKNESGESYLLYTLSGAPREAFANFPMPRNSALFAPTFRGEGAVRIGDVRRDPRFGRNPPYHGMPKGHLPVVSYLAVSVKSRSGEVLGGLFFGHAQPDVFTAESETAISALAAQAAIAIENSRLYAALRTELARTKESEMASRRLAAIVESSDDAIVSKDLNGIIASWNSGAQRIFGYTPDEIIGQSVTVLIPADRLDEEPQILARLRRGERVDHFETVRRRKDGALLDVSLTISPIKDATGRVIGASKIARDITARRRVEARQRSLYDMLASVNRAAALPEIYAAALETILRCQNAERAAILLYDEEKVMRFVAWRGLSDGYRAAVEGHSPWAANEREAQPVCIEDVAAVELDAQVRAAVEGEGIRALAFIPLGYEKRLLGKFMIYYDAPHRFTPEELELARAIATQIAFAIERQKGAQALEALVNERTASLRQAIAQMEEFSYSVSHDLRSPVRAMRGYAEAVLEDYGDRLDADGRELLARINRNGQRMDRLIQDLLTFSRLTRREMKVEPVAVDRLVAELAQQYPEMRPERADIVIVGEVPRVLAHEPSLVQVLSNLLSNAVKFVAPDVRPRVQLRAELRDGRVRLWVEDNGIGIPPQYQHRLFGMFERVHPEKNYEGTGIGLAIVRKAVERMNGAAGVESDGVSGSRFWIELPAAPES